MVPRQQIKAFVSEVVTRFHSDVDLLVVTPHKGPPAVQAAEIRKQVRAGFPMDLVVRSPKEIDRRLAMGDFFVREVLQRGRALYEA